MKTSTILVAALGFALTGSAIAHTEAPHADKKPRAISADEHAFGREGDPKKATRTVKVDMRVVSSTSRTLPEEIAAARFREDPYYRLNVVPVHLPALAERREDIPELVRHFAARYAVDQRVATPEVSDDAMAALQAYDWPGNVRQLRNVIERTIILAPGERIGSIDIDMLPPEILNEQAQLNPGEAVKAIMGTPLREARETFEREYLKVQIRRFSGNISRTANFIGMERSALHRKLKALGLGDTRGGGDGNE